MKYVYVLTSTPQDLYYEQCLMSAWSLRQKMPNADIIILVDDKTYSSFSLNNKRTELIKIATNIIQIEFDSSISNIERSRLIKTSIPKYIDDSFLYIDCDTIICDDLSSIEEEPFEIAGVLDGHCLLSEHIHKEYFLKRDKKLGFHGTKASNYNINGGVILAKKGKDTDNLFEKWNEIWKYSAYQKHDFHDQSALNEANYRIGLKMGLLSGIWNCQPSHGGLAFLKDAKIIHYYSSEFFAKNYIPYYKLADINLQNKIKETGFISTEVQKMILNPKFQFNNVHLINDKRILSIIQSPIIFSFAELKIKVPFLFNIIESIFTFIRMLGKKIIRRKD